MHFHSLWVQYIQVYIQDFWNLKLWRWITTRSQRVSPWVGVRESVPHLRCKRCHPLLDGCPRMETVGGCAGVRRRVTSQEVGSCTATLPSSEDMVWQCSSPELFLRPKAESVPVKAGIKPCLLPASQPPATVASGCLRGAVDTVTTRKSGCDRREKLICDCWLNTSKSFRGWCHLVQDIRAVSAICSGHVWTVRCLSAEE